MPVDIPSAETPAQARTLGFLLREVYAVLQARIYGAVAAAGHPGVRPMHSPVLRHLGPGGGRVADIARASGLAKQSVAYVVEDLVAQGYLSAEPDPDDRRARRLAYTPRGRRLLAALMKASRDAEAEVARVLGERRAIGLRESLEALHAMASTTPADAPGSRHVR